MLITAFEISTGSVKVGLESSRWRLRQVLASEDRAHLANSCKVGSRSPASPSHWNFIVPTYQTHYRYTFNCTRKSERGKARTFAGLVVPICDELYWLIDKCERPSQPHLQWPAIELNPLGLRQAPSILTLSDGGSYRFRVPKFRRFQSTTYKTMLQD